MKVAALALLGCVLASPACASTKDDQKAAQGLIACAPKTYEGALDCLDRNLTPEMKSELKKPKGSVMAHFGLGMFLRNNWGLWQGGDLAKDMNRLGFTHPDDMSGTILEGYGARLNGMPFDLANKAAEYRAYWTKLQNRKPADPKECAAKTGDLRPDDIKTCYINDDGSIEIVRAR